LIGRAICPASCGEIVQGTIRGQDFLITCPIALYTEVTVRLRNFEGVSFKEENKKAYMAAKKVLDRFDADILNITIDINSDIPQGIGLSSSTADITAACLATAEALGVTICPDIIADIALSIEPSDGLMYPGAWIFDHIQGNWKEGLGPLPDMDVYIIDTSECVDTLSFNHRCELKQLNVKKEAQVREALDMVYEAFYKDDPKLLGMAMMKSGMAHQPILYKQHLPEIMALVRNYDILLGVNIAHSGSALGVFCVKGVIPPEQFWERLDYIMNKHGKKYEIIKTHIDNNGPRVLR